MVLTMKDYQHIREESLTMNGRRMYEWVIRFKNDEDDDIVKEAGGLMIANNADEVMEQFRSEYGYGDCIEFKIKRSDMSVFAVPGHGVTYKTLWVRELSEDEIENGICSNDIFQDEKKDVIFISNHPVKERIIK